MYKLCLAALLGVVCVLTSCDKAEKLSPAFYTCQFGFDDKSTEHPKAVRYQTFIDGLTQKGIPGIILLVNTPAEGAWIGASGKADIGNNINMQPCNISRAGSTVKTFTSVAILMLAEEGKLSLDDPVSEYIPKEITDKIQNASQSSIRQLLQHSSGIYNYIQDLQFQTTSLNNLKKVWQPEELLAYAYHKKAYFNPGEDIRYSNTAYILLGMIIEKVSGKHFTEVFKEKIFDPLQLQNTSFDLQHPVPAGIVRGYIDFFSDYNLVESTYFSGWDYYTADGGLISNPYDLHLFVSALFEGKLLNQNSLNEMQTWRSKKAPDPDFFPMSYGLGIFRIETPYGIAYYHSGDAIGYYANMMYFPDKKISIVWQTNGNYGKLDKHISSKEAILDILSAVFD